MLLIVLAGLLLLLVMSFVPGAYLTKQVGAERQMGPRDDLPEPTPELARARRAFANLQETLPIFLTLGVLSVVLGEEGWLSIGGGLIYLVARAAHPICYIKALSPARSIAYTVGMLGLVAMAVPVIGHLWG
jgi:uncharacterized MAPEG superfamily protein